MKNHFFIPYFGNKREEVEIIYELIKDDLENVETIIEPYCGSCALSFYISLKNPNKFKYILNDNNKYLIQLLEIAKDEEAFNKLVKELINIQENIKCKEDYKNFISNENFEAWLIGNSWYNIRPYMYNDGCKTKFNYNNFLKKNEFLNFIRNEKIELMNEDAIKIYEEFNKENCLLLLDPPYLDANNDFYLNGNSNIYEHIYNNNIKLNKAKTFLILENIWIIKLLFKDFNTFEYDKQYRNNHKKTKHILIKNI